MLLVFFIVVAINWFVLYGTHALLQKWDCCSRAYREFLRKCGLSISPGQLKWFTVGCPRWVEKLGGFSGLKLWFDLGALASCILLLLSVPLLSFILLRALQQPADKHILRPVLPGINVPWSQVFHYGLTLLFTAVFHELGHALAAVREQVRVDGYGVFLVFIYPGAFVDLHKEHLSAISPRRQLRIYSAGVWHNLVLTIVAGLFLWLMTVLLWPMFTTGLGAVVTHVSKDSALHGQLPLGTHMTKINDCVVNGQEEWRKCLDRTVEHRIGYCVPLTALLRKNGQLKSLPTLPGSPHDCCGFSQSDICFSYESTKGHTGQACLTARNVTANDFCTRPRHCLHGNSEGKAVACVKPVVDPVNRLLRLRHSDGIDVLFEGSPYLVLFQVHVSDYSPRWFWVSGLYWLPPVLLTAFTYIFSLSSALGFLNMVPVYMLDGHWVLFSLVEWLLGTTLPNPRVRSKICHSILLVGTFLLLANIIVALSGVLGAFFY